MAERVKEKMLEHKVVDLVAGPDAYRDLPNLLNISEQSDVSAMNV
jgi:tRNA-2-methylthio-N6-dimethylallyladenosine synthase